MFKKLIILPLFILTVILINGCTVSEETITTKDLTPIDLITDVTIDKARYNPNDKITFSINLYNRSEQPQLGDLHIDLIHINNTILTSGKVSVSVNANEKGSTQIEILAPSTDFTGYMARVSYTNNDNIDIFTIGVDVSSDWSKFPRYGYLVNYGNISDAFINYNLETLNKYHINGLQFYDWQYKHNLPLPLDEAGNPRNNWLEIANRVVTFKTVKNYIEGAHQYNMMAMNYNLIFGSYENGTVDGVNLDWGLYKDTNGQDIDYHPLPGDWQTSKILLLNPANQDWQNYIFNQMEIAHSKLPFDGWHVDQLGDRGPRFDANGNSINLAESYVDLLNNAKDELNTRLVFNAVDGYSQDNIAKNVPVDFLYTEVWSSKTYYSLKSIIDNGYAKTNNEKSMILAAYMNYGSNNRPGQFNTPAILLTDAVIFASGGAHLELGDTGMLGSEYFPNENLKMTIDLKTRLRAYYDFAVAYQNLLRDNVFNVGRNVIIENVNVSKFGSNDTIWSFSKQRGNQEMIHFINLIDNQNDWRDDNQTKKVPPLQENLNVKYYIDKTVEKVQVASPDFNQGLTIDLPFTTGSDDKGAYITFTLPSLLYWDMVILQTK